MIKRIFMFILILMWSIPAVLSYASSPYGSNKKSKAVTGYMFGGPGHYAEGKMPVSKWEQQAFDEYKQKTQERIKPGMTTTERDRVNNGVAMEIAEKYKMPPISVAYLVLKLLYHEAPPPGYVKPSKPRKE